MSIKRKIRFWYQRRTRGFDDSETFSLDYSLAKLILPRLQRFKQVSIDVLPSEMTSEEWSEILDKMINAFDYYSSKRRWSSTEDHEEGLKLFAQYYTDLWW